MRGLGSGSFDPKTIATLEAAFDEAWLTLRCNGNDKVRANELGRCILRLASEGERDAVRLHDNALAALAPAMVWREAQPSEFRTCRTRPRSVYAPQRSMTMIPARVWPLQSLFRVASILPV